MPSKAELIERIDAYFMDLAARGISAEDDGLAYRLLLLAKDALGGGLADNGLTIDVVEDMRVSWQNNPAMPFAQRVVFSNICDAAIAALKATP